MMSTTEQRARQQATDLSALMWHIGTSTMVDHPFARPPHSPGSTAQRGGLADTCRTRATTRQPWWAARDSNPEPTD